MRFGRWKVTRFAGLFLLFILTLSISSQLQIPAPSGPYAVGSTRLRWIDTSRPEVLTEEPDDFREVAALVWYPAQPGTGQEAGYFPNLSSLSDTLIESGELIWWQVSGLRLVSSEIRLDANLIKPEAPFPVVILSPGNGTNVEFYSRLAGEIASQGYLVIGINHPYDVPAVQLSSGEVAPYDKHQWLLDAKGHQAYSAGRVLVRTADMLYVLDQLAELNSTGRFAGAMDLNAVAAAGHSLGGITASEACKADARLKACLNFDGIQMGGPFSMDETAFPPQQPFLFLTKESELPPKLMERFESMPESYWVVIHGASHQSFTDGPVLQPSLLPGPNDADRLMGLIRQYTLAFLDSTLKGQTSDLLSQTLEEEDVSVNVFLSEARPKN